MSCQTTANFYKEKQEWSIVKDNLLNCYLFPYASKVFTTGKPILYIDGFAGAGLFGDSQIVPTCNINDYQFPPTWGSPLIALKNLSKASKATTMINPCFKAVFIESKYQEQLKRTLENSQFAKDCYEIIPKDIKESIVNVIDNYEGDKPNVFCYLDPFGLKDLKIGILRKMDRPALNSFELLINFNSFGFLRAACAYLHVSIRETKINDLLLELGGHRCPSNDRAASDAMFTEIMDCDAWKNIIVSYKNKKIDGYEAEDKISNLYKQQLGITLGLQYVLDIPIRFNSQQQPKYRMVYATNHADGACLMADTMRKRQDYLYVKPYLEQLTLFDTPRNTFESLEQVSRNLISLLPENEEKTSKQAFAEYYMRFGLTSHTRAKILMNAEKKE